MQAHFPGSCIKQVVSKLSVLGIPFRKYVYRCLAFINYMVSTMVLIYYVHYKTYIKTF